MDDVLLALATALYLLAAAGYVVFLVHSREETAVRSRRVLAAGLAVHTLAIAARCSQGIPPVLAASDTISFFAWFVAAGYLGVQLRWSLPTVGTFVAPLLGALTLVSLLLPRPDRQLGPVFETVWFPVHVIMALAGDVAFVLAAAVGLMYLIQETNLKAKRSGGWFEHLPNLEILDRVNHRLVAIGFPLLTLGIVSGGLWVQASPEVEADPLDPRVLWTLVTWVLYAGLLHGRLRMGLRGRKAAWLSVAGFAIVVLAFVTVSVLGEGFHSFSR